MTASTLSCLPGRRENKSNAVGDIGKSTAGLLALTFSHTLLTSQYGVHGEITDAVLAQNCT